MARDTMILLFCLVALLAAGWLGYRVFFDSPSEAARQHEEAVKRAQLEADLLRAVAEGNGQTGNSGTPSQRYTHTTPRPRPT
ncbi:MAG: hypothetical protein JSW66_00585 [Phycisphaerales bacterium]|nr:MAG: hypothetical protein JSW66_00585 [Phycisphaerales bacterium]